MCVIREGRILFAAQEERYSRIKNDKDFPTRALRKAMEFCALKAEDVQAVAFYEKPFLKFERLLQNYLHTAPRGLRSFTEAMDSWSGQKLFIKSEIRKGLEAADAGFQRCRPPLLFPEHHLSHAASAFYPSPFEEAAILTVDGVGEYTTTSLALGKGNAIQILKEVHYPHSIGLLYSAVTYFLGFKVNSDEYKVMGLAAYGNPDSPEYQRFRNIIETELVHTYPDGSYRLNMAYFSYPYALRMVDDRQWEALFSLRKRKPEDELNEAHCNLAFAFQQVTEAMVMALCREIQQQSHAEYLCLAGGVALNSVANGVIQRSGLFREIFTQPAAGDAGGAMGAALAAWHIHYGRDRRILQPDALQNSLLGCSADEAAIEALAAQHAHRLTEGDDELCSLVAAAIAEGKVVGWYQGRMEFGPRALGNRSILGDARNSEMQKHLNLKIKNRESFRPFAPAILEEDINEYIDFHGRSPYMLQVHPVHPRHLCELPPHFRELSLQEKLYTLKSDIPAVTHVDLSARIQTVNREQHPLFWKLIYTFRQQTGCGLLINTSFNVKDEPIVCTPEDAFRCFQQTGMDLLVLHHYLFYKS